MEKRIFSLGSSEMVGSLILRSEKRTTNLPVFPVKSTSKGPNKTNRTEPNPTFIRNGQRLFRPKNVKFLFVSFQLCLFACQLSCTRTDFARPLCSTSFYELVQPRGSRCIWQLNPTLFCANFHPKLGMELPYSTTKRFKAFLILSRFFKAGVHGHFEKTPDRCIFRRQRKQNKNNNPRFEAIDGGGDANQVEKIK